MLTFPILIGAVCAGAVVVAGLAYRSAPARVRCPQCGSRTRVVIPRVWPAQVARHITWRWCRVCQWEGMARRGPEYVPGRPAAHDSGFQWGAERMPEDFGFRWAAPLPDAEPAGPPPAHPSGFRWTTKAAPPEVARPGGFVWRHDPEALAPLPTPAHPPGFFWAAHRPEPRFEWGKPERTRTRPPGFRWKDAS